MQASIVDLRYKMSYIKKAIENSQIVAITNRGSVIAKIFPCNDSQACLAERHPFFGSIEENGSSVEEVMSELRGGRYNAL